jgi:tRNA pseudouridine55 synthase
MPGTKTSIETGSVAAEGLARRPALSGVLLVDKPKGMTSHGAVASIRRVFGQREVGHTGTLDPMATGLLVLTLGRATRIARFIEATDKVYIGTVTLGRSTTTFDAEGETTGTKPVEEVDDARVRSALSSLIGTRTQKVPPYSAVKVGGERLYSKARRNEEFDAPEREVTIHQLELVKLEHPSVTIRAHVSKGTYIRSLAVELGDALGTAAHLSMLRRTDVGSHSVDQAHPLPEIRGEPGELMSMAEALRHLPVVRVRGSLADDVRHGRRIPAPEAQRDGETVVILGSDGEVWAVGVCRGERIAYACVLVR